MKTDYNKHTITEIRFYNNIIKIPVAYKWYINTQLVTVNIAPYFTENKWFIKIKYDYDILQ